MECPVTPKPTRSPLFSLRTHFLDASYSSLASFLPGPLPVSHPNPASLLMWSSCSHWGMWSTLQLRLPLKDTGRPRHFLQENLGACAQDNLGLGAQDLGPGLLPGSFLCSLSSFRAPKPSEDTADSSSRNPDLLWALIAFEPWWIPLTQELGSSGLHYRVSAFSFQKSTSCDHVDLLVLLLLE